MKTKVLMTAVFLISAAVIVEKKAEKEYEYVLDAEYVCIIKQFTPSGEITKTYYTKEKIDIETVAIVDVRGAIIDVSKFPYKSCRKITDTKRPSLLDWLP
nr:MAG TPA: hypothetical protein [Caudoviricetes sp.]